MANARREVARLTLKDYTTGIPFLYIPYGQVVTTEHSGDTVYARGDWNNGIKAAFNGNRAAQLSLETTVFDYKLIAFLAGTSVSTGTTNIFKREVLKATGTESVTIALSETPVTDSITVFPIAKDCDSTSKMVITVADKSVTLTAGVADDSYVAYYYTATAANDFESVTFNSTKFPAACKMSGLTKVKDTDGNKDKYEYMEVYNAQAQAGFNITMNNDGDPSSMTVTFDLMEDADGNTITYSKAV